MYQRANPFTNYAMSSDNVKRAPECNTWPLSNFVWSEILHSAANMIYKRWVKLVYHTFALHDTTSVLFKL